MFQIDFVNLARQVTNYMHVSSPIIIYAHKLFKLKLFLDMVL